MTNPNSIDNGANAIPHSNKVTEGIAAESYFKTNTKKKRLTMK
jgi:hypothetical protein